jgi:hypothetical protein
MEDFELTWRLTRGRFDDTVKGLTQEQLNWRLHPGALTIGEMVVHVAGVEVFFIRQLTDTPVDEFGQKVSDASTEGVVNDNPFPISPVELTPELAERALALARLMVESTLANPASIPEGKEIKSALGPTIDARGAFARLAYHPGYHQGQAHILKTAPAFPG